MLHGTLKESSSFRFVRRECKTPRERTISLKVFVTGGLSLQERQAVGPCLVMKRRRLLGLIRTVCGSSVVHNRTESKSESK